MKSFYRHSTDNIGLYVLLGLFSILFLLRLDYNTLSSWDEAWYGTIAREMIRNGDFLRMHFNTLPYFDHPPVGFWLMTISYKLFGISEWSTRLPSALCGIATILLVYLTGIRLFGKKSIGFVAALIMGTCVWYVLRVRSGNLDSTFVFFYILTVYLALRTRENIKWFIPTMMSFALLFLTKTLVGLSASILILLTNAKHFPLIIHEKDRRNIEYVVWGILLAAIIILPWYLVNFFSYQNFYQHHFLDIGTRNKSLTSFAHFNFALPLFYLHMGIRKWYYLWFGALVIIFVKRDFMKKQVAFLLVWNMLVLYPFLTTNKTEIWHLIPVYLPTSLIIAYEFYEFLTIVFRMNILSFRSVARNLGVYMFLTLFILLAFFQVKTFYPEVIPQSKFTPDDVAIATSSHSLKQQVFLDDDFLPMAVYYADRTVYPLRELGFYTIKGNKGTLVDFFKSDEKDFAVITRIWAINNLKSEKIPFKVIAKNNSFVIVTR